MLKIRDFGSSPRSSHDAMSIYQGGPYFYISVVDTSGQTPDRLLEVPLGKCRVKTTKGSDSSIEGVRRTLSDFHFYGEAITITERPFPPEGHPRLIIAAMDDRQVEFY